MKLKLHLILSIFFLISASSQAKTYRFFYLGEQSNMDGYGYVNELPKELNQPMKGVFIWIS